MLVVKVWETNIVSDHINAYNSVPLSDYKITRELPLNNPQTVQPDTHNLTADGVHSPTDPSLTQLLDTGECC